VPGCHFGWTAHTSPPDVDFRIRLVHASAHSTLAIHWREACSERFPQFYDLLALLHRSIREHMAWRVGAWYRILQTFSVQLHNWIPFHRPTAERLWRVQKSSLLTETFIDSPPPHFLWWRPSDDISSNHLWNRRNNRHHPMMFLSQSTHICVNAFSNYAWLTCLSSKALSMVFF
jgi:hypothetical protein